MNDRDSTVNELQRFFHHMYIFLMRPFLYSAPLGIDECSTTDYICEVCINNEGSLDCLCLLGYNRSSDNDGTCEGKSVCTW